MKTLNTFLKLLVPTILLLFSCGPSQEEIALEKRMEEERIIDSVRIENYNYYKDLSDDLMIRDQKRGAALTMYCCIQYADKNRGKLADSLANFYLSQKMYQEGLLAYDIAVSESYNLKETYFERAKCYEKIKERALAVIDLKEAIKLGNEDADKLHNRINPEKRKITGYVTRCCDGTTSNATGRGACSQHGGVCDWTEPVYKTYREYE